jgi:hypothetical protein
MAEEHDDAVGSASRPASWSWAISSAPGSRDFEAVV